LAELVKAASALRVTKIPPQPMRLFWLAAAALACVVAFMTLGANGQWSFVIPFRGGKLIAMLLVAYAVAVSSVLFQTITHNRILTPAIMGFDALYLLIQAVVVFGFGQAATAANHPVAAFLLEVCAMTAFACLLFRWLFSDAVRSLHLMMLVGIIFGLLFRSLSNFMVRLIDPNEFLVLQDRMFASFNSVRVSLLPIAFAAVCVATLVIWRMRHRYDVLALGREIAVNLGVDYRRSLMLTLGAIAVLVSVSTALVGPVTFFGLLVSNLAYHAMGSDKHKYTIPAATMLSVIFLVGGQTLLERVLGLNTTVSVVIEFVGGVMFLVLILRKGRR
jgi:iron complex transport system permease protein